MKKQAGFTLIELLAVITVLGVMVSLAVPSFTNMIDRNNTLSVANDLLADIQLARSEAIKRDTTVTIFPTGAGWANGWQATTFMGDIILTREAAKKGLTISAGGGISFNGTGRSTFGGVQKFEIRKGDCSNGCKYDVTLSLTGQPKVTLIH